MNYSNLFKIALRAIFANKMRSFLTALGIIIGIASVITMLAVGQGTKRSIQANISEMGSNMIMISPGADMRGGVRQDASAMETLKLNDYESIKEGCTYVKAVSPMVTSGGQFIYGNNNAPSTVYGVNQDYLEIRQLSISDGEMFTDADIKTSAKVCILGQTVIDNLFPDGGDPIGKVIRFNAIPFRVVGVLKKKGYNSMGMDQDDLVLAPYTTVMKRILAQTYLGGIQCSAVTEGVADYDNSTGALGYSVWYYAANMYAMDEVKILKVDGVAPDAAAIEDGSYPYVQPFYAVLRSDAPEDSAARRIYDFLLTEAGQQLVRACGYAGAGDTSES